MTDSLEDPRFIGVTRFYRLGELPRISKKWVLLFDAVAVPNSRTFVEYERAVTPKGDSKNFELEDIAWLIDRGLVLDPVYKGWTGPFSIAMPTALNIISEFRNELSLSDELVDKLTGWNACPHAVLATEPETDATGGGGRNSNELRTMIEMYSSLVPRAISLRYRKAGKDSVALIAKPNEIGEYTATAESCKKQNTVASLVLKALPEPDELTSWERIMEFRADKDARQQMLALRRWMRKIASSNFHLSEMEDELEYLLTEYETSLRIHRLKINKGVLETLVTISAEALENLLKVKLGALAKLPFLIQERKLALLEAEQSAPGRELAYILKARKAFS